MSSLSQFKEEFYIFTVKQWQKILKSEEKHKNYSMKFNDVKEHYIKEILESFKIEKTLKGYFIYKELMRYEIDENELIDVANLAFALSIAEK